MSDKRNAPILEDLRNRLNIAYNRHKAAIRWIFDAKRFKNDFTGADNWKGGPEAELASIAQITFTEAAQEVINSRIALQKARKAYDEYFRGQ